ncbi:MAG: XRE family transcriptional regulator [Lachnospiraceae bacterium]|nr:XRE family transcriptional regulator [Lachnospiraceae bacterium]
MNVGEIIAVHRKKKKLSQPALAEQLGNYGFDVTYKAVSKWETNTSEPSVTMFFTICKILEITNLYELFFGSNEHDPLSFLNDEGKQKVMEYADILIASGRYQKEENVIPFQRKVRFYDLPASAGIGNFLDYSEYEEIQVGQEVPGSTDFGILISGDSMEPRFHDGQIAWVHSQDTLEPGEIGIFLYNGNVYIKEFSVDEHGVFLHSLNPDYRPIRINDNYPFKIFGKVLGSSNTKKVTILTD